MAENMLLQYLNSGLNLSLDFVTQYAINSRPDFKIEIEKASKKLSLQM